MNLENITFLLGLLSFLQITFLPGYIILKYTRIIKTNGIQLFVYSFGFSLLFNYMVVLILTLSGLNNSAFIYFLVAVEVALLVLLKTKSRGNIQINNKESNSQGFRELLDTTLLKHREWKGVIFLSLLVFGFYLLLFVGNLGSIFYKNDAVVSWNRWASLWAHNQIPTDNLFYPQLIPVNWSLSYLFMQNDSIWFFAKAIMPLFPLVSLLLFFDLAIQEENSNYLWGAVIYGILLVYFFNPVYITDGYVDIAVSTLGFLAFHSIFLYKKFGNQFKHLLITISLASAAAVTKQVALYILGFIFLWSIVEIYKTKVNKKRVVNILLVMAIILAVTSLYFIRQFIIHGPYDNLGANISLWHSLFGGKTYLETLADALKSMPIMRGKIGVPVFLVIFILYVRSIFNKETRLIALLIIPYTIFWGMFVSYSNRNLALIIPFLAYTCCFGGVSNLDKYWEKLSGKIAEKYEKLSDKANIRIVLLILAGLIFLIVGAVLKSDIFREIIYRLVNSTEKPTNTFDLLGQGFIVMAGLTWGYILVTRIGIDLRKLSYTFVAVILFLNFTFCRRECLSNYQFDQQRMLGDKQINSLLYAYKSKSHIKGKILTDYQYLGYLPELEKTYCLYQDTIDENYISRLDGQKDISYLLVDYPKKLNIDITPAAMNMIESKIKTNEYKLIFRVDSKYFLKIN